jgi:hypothetical protein
MHFLLKTRLDQKLVPSLLQFPQLGFDKYFNQALMIDSVRRGFGVCLDLHGHLVEIPQEIIG